MDSLPNPFTLVSAMALLALLPFLAVTVSSFVKISVVILLVRNALGVQQIPPAMAVNGLAIILSVYVMAPVGMQVWQQLGASGVDPASIDWQSPPARAAALSSFEPLRDFLLAHSDPAERAFFHDTTVKLWPPELAAEVTPEHPLVLLPAFTTSELTEAFQIGFLLYLPFIAIDLIVSNILLAMGMMMVSPLTISLPFKLLLFVSVDGWGRLIHGLVLSYQT